MSKQKYSLWQTVFTVMILVPLFLGHRHAIDPAHARASALFRLSVILIGIVGLLVTWVLTRRSSKREARPTEGLPTGIVISEYSSIPEGDVVEWSINDRSTRADVLRCNLYILTHRSQTVIPLVCLPVLISCGIALPVAPSRPLLAAYIAAGIFAAWFLFLGVVVYIDLLKRYPRPDSDRLCTTTLTQMGFEDVTPNGSTFVPWSQVTEILERAGDIYLWRMGGKGNYITRNAFQNLVEAREFQSKALGLWKSPVPLPAGMLNMPATAYQTTVWPPPPQA